MRTLYKPLLAVAALALMPPVSAQKYPPVFENFDAYQTPGDGSGVKDVLLATAGSTVVSSAFVNGLVARVQKAAGQNNLGVVGFRSYPKAFSASNVYQYAWKNKPADQASSLTNMFVRALTRGTIDEYNSPTVDLTGKVRFKILVDPGSLNSVNFQGLPQSAFNFRVCLSIVPTNIQLLNTADPLGKLGYTGGGNDIDTVFYVGNTNTPATNDTLDTPGAFAPGGVLVTAGQPNNPGSAPTWTTVEIDLATAKHDRARGSADWPAGGGLGFLESINFTPVSPANSQVFVLYIDDFEIVRGPVLEGTVTRTGYNAAAPSLPFEFAFRNAANTTLFTRHPGITGSGKFTLPSIPPANYRLGVKGENTLRVVIPGVNLTAGDVSLTTPNLPAGDTTGDNSVNFDDFLALADAYFTTKDIDSLYNPDADFNGDGQVNFDDFLLLAANYFVDGQP